MYNNDLQHGFEYYFQNIKSISQPPTSKTCYQKGIEAKNEFCDINYLLELRNSIRKLVFTPDGQLKEAAVNLYKETLNELLEKL